MQYQAHHVGYGNDTFHSISGPGVFSSAGPSPFTHLVAQNFVDPNQISMLHPFIDRGFSNESTWCSSYSSTASATQARSTVSNESMTTLSAPTRSNTDKLEDILCGIYPNTLDSKPHHLPTFVPICHQSPQTKHQRVHPVSKPTTTRYMPDGVNYNLKTTADRMAHKLITTNTHRLRGIATMKKVVRQIHLRHSTEDVVAALQSYMSNLEVFCIPESIPVWWPPGLDYQEYVNLEKESKHGDISFLLHQLTSERLTLCCRSPSAAP
jgi:hypothetical protein